MEEAENVFLGGINTVVFEKLMEVTDADVSELEGVDAFESGERLEVALLGEDLPYYFDFFFEVGDGFEEFSEFSLCLDTSHVDSLRDGFFYLLCIRFVNKFAMQIIDNFIAVLL